MLPMRADVRCRKCGAIMDRDIVGGTESLQSDAGSPQVPEVSSPRPPAKGAEGNAAQGLCSPSKTT